MDFEVRSCQCCQCTYISLHESTVCPVFLGSIKMSKVFRQPQIDLDITLQEVKECHLKQLENERTDFDMMMELTLNKHKQRQDYLQKSLDVSGDLCLLPSFFLLFFVSFILSSFLVHLFSCSSFFFCSSFFLFFFFFSCFSFFFFLFFSFCFLCLFFLFLFFLFYFLVPLFFFSCSSFLFFMFLFFSLCCYCFFSCWHFSFSCSFFPFLVPLLLSHCVLSFTCQSKSKKK